MTSHRSDPDTPRALTWTSRPISHGSLTRCPITTHGDLTEGICPDCTTVHGARVRWWAGPNLADGVLEVIADRDDWWARARISVEMIDWYGDDMLEDTVARTVHVLGDDR